MGAPAALAVVGAGAGACCASPVSHGATPFPPCRLAQQPVPLLAPSPPFSLPHSCHPMQRGITPELGAYLLPLVHDKEQRWVAISSVLSNKFLFLFRFEACSTMSSD